MRTDLRPQLATVAEALDDVAPELRDAAEGSVSTSEAEAMADAAGRCLRLARQLRNLTYFTPGVAGASARAGAGLRASPGSRPGAQLRLLDGTEDHAAPIP